MRRYETQGRRPRTLRRNCLEGDNVTICYHDIVVTGVAAISPAGVGTEPLLRAIEEGGSRLTPVPEELLGDRGGITGERPTASGSPISSRRSRRESSTAAACWRWPPPASP
ncbi:hypothetical protein [Geomonas sp. Red276]